MRPCPTQNWFPPNVMMIGGEHGSQGYKEGQCVPSRIGKYEKRVARWSAPAAEISHVKLNFQPRVMIQSLFCLFLLGPLNAFPHAIKASWLYLETHTLCELSSMSSSMGRRQEVFTITRMNSPANLCSMSIKPCTKLKSSKSWSLHSTFNFFSFFLPRWSLGVTIYAH